MSYKPIIVITILLLAVGLPARGAWAACNCPWQGDIDTSGCIDVFDVIGVTGIAFSGGLDIQDPECPTTRGDVNKDWSTDVFDVIQIIALAFSGGTVTDPCSPAPSTVMSRTPASVSELTLTQLTSQPLSPAPVSAMLPSNASMVASVVVESKNVTLNASGVTIGVFLTNDVAIKYFVIPLELRSTSGGAFITNMKRSYPAGTRLDGKLPINIANWYDGDTVGTCKGGLAGGYTGVINQDQGVFYPVVSSPEAVFFARGKLFSEDLPAGTDGSNPQMLLTVDVNGSNGTFEIDTTCTDPCNHLIFVNTSDNTGIVPAFTKGLITVGTPVPPNSPPVPRDTSLATNEDVAKVVTYLPASDPDAGQTLTFITLTSPVNGSIGAMDPNTGAFTYTPNPNFCGLDSLQFMVCDDAADMLCAPAWVRITVNCVNDEPVARDTVWATNQDTPKSVTYLPASDIDVGQTKTFAILSGPFHGGTSGFTSATGAFTYTPNAGYNGPDSLKFTVCDNGVPVKCDTGTVRITVIIVNLPPVLDSIRAKTVAEGASLTFRTHATDPDGTVPTQFAVGVPLNATFMDSVNGAGSFAFNPSFGQAGVYSVTFIASDGSLADSEIVVITVSCASDSVAPVITCPSDVVVDNSPNSCGAVVSFAAPGASDNCPGVSVASVPPSGSFFPVGNTLVTSTATDASGNQNTCTFYVIVTDNEKPTVTCPAPIVVTVPNGQTSAVVIYSVTTYDNCPGLISVLTPPSGSTFPLGSTDVKCVVTDASGNKDSCTFQVSVVVGNPVENNPPEARDTSWATNQDTPKPVSYLPASDIDVGQTNTFAILSGPSHGSLGATFVPATGAFTYTPTGGYSGPDSLKFTVCDNGAPVLCDTGTVRITVLSFANSVVVESKTVLAGATGVPIGIFLTNDVAIQAYAIPLELRSTSGGAFITNMKRSYPAGTRLDGKLTDLNIINWYDGDSVGTCKNGQPGGYAGIVNQTQDVIFPVMASPEAVMFVRVRVFQGDLPPGTDGSNPQMLLTVDVNDSAGTFEIDTTCANPANHLWFARSTGTPSMIIPIFTKGVITIAPFVPNTPPVAQCQSVTVSANANCQAAASINNGSYDPDTGDTITLVQVPPDPYSRGITLVQLIVTDNHGAANTCQGTVSVLDTLPLEITCPPNITRSTDPGRCSTIVSYNVTVNKSCPGVTLAANPPSGSYFLKGATGVTAIATDSATGEADTCVFLVTVNDNEVPVASCPGDTTVGIGASDSSAVVAFNSYVSDNCSGASIACVPPSGSSFPLGVSLVTCTATDAVGNQSTCAFTVNVVWRGYPPVLRWVDPLEPIPGVSPDLGDAGTYFDFEVIYSDADGAPPLAGYPKLRIDFDGDTLLNGPKDAVYSMWPTGSADYVTGRKYRYRTTLPLGTAYRFSFAAFDQTGDPAQGAAAWTWIDAPDVITDLPDLYIYASDINFSSSTPAVGDTFFVSGTVHNNSDSSFTNVPVEISDKYGPIGTVLLASLPANGTATVTQGFRYSVDGYYTFRFTVDPGNAIVEWNETNNSAVRGLTVGNPVLPGWIRILAQTTNPALPQDWVTVSGRADYFGPDSLEPVSGAAVTVDVQNYQSFATFTDDNGNFSRTFRAPSNIGTYPMTVSVTDYTLSSDTTLALQVVSCLQPLPDLICNLSLSRIPKIENVDDTTSITSVYVYNLCDYPASNFWVHLYKDGVIIDSAGPIAHLGPREPYYPPAWQNLALKFTGAGDHSVACYADLRNTVVENSEENNQATISFFLWCGYPDLTPKVPYPQSLAYVGQATTLHARVYNQGGIAIPDTLGIEPASSFAVRFRVTKGATVFEGTSQHTIGAFGAAADASFNVEFPDTGWYWVAVTADAAGQIVECNEGNNETGWWIYVDDLRVNLQIGYEDITVTDPYANADGQTVKLLVVVHNRGNGTATNVPVVFRVDTSQVGEVVTIPSIAPYSTQSAASAVDWVVNRAACVITAMADPANVIPETNELDNSGSVPAVFELYPLYGGRCPNFTWPMFNLCAAGVGEPVTIYARAQTSGAFNLLAPVAVQFQDDIEGDLGTVNLSGFYNHRLSVPVANLVYAFSVPGWHTVTATVDANSQYPECDENNNSATGRIWIGFKPDLMVRSEYIDPNPLNPDPGDSVAISVDIYNIGHAVADNVKVVFEIDGLLLGDTVTIASIPAPPSTNNYVGIQATQRWLATEIPTNIHIARVITDAAGTIPEDNEDNNEATRALIVGAAPDLWVDSSDIDFSNYYPGIGFPTTISAVIHNRGEMAASATVEVFHVDGPDTASIGTISLPSVPAGGSVPASIVWIISSEDTEVHVRITSSDPQEYDLTNNEAHRRFRLVLNGDCQRDFTIDVFDIICLIDVAFQGGTIPDPWYSIDVNCDHYLDVFDVVYLIDFVFSGGTEPCDPAPAMLSKL